jgi:Tfp pilus assembly protein PilF
LAEATAGWGWDAENTEVLKEIVAEFPREKGPMDQLANKFYAAGNTRELGELVAKIYAANMSDARSKNNLANIFLLRKADLDTAYRLAREAYNSAPENPFYTSTYAYSLLMQKKPDEAVKVFNGMKPEFLQIPSVAAYYGVVQAQSGHKDAAKAPLERAATAKLLPEENEMVRLAKASL